MAWSEEIRRQYFQIKSELDQSGGQEKVEREHNRGKLTAYERLCKLYDGESFTSIEAYRKSRVELSESSKKNYWGDGVISAVGTVNGHTVFAVAQDCTICGGSGGEAHINKICRALEMAIENRCPIVFLCDSGGARIDEGIISLAAYSRLFYLNTRASGLIPQISAIMGNCAGGSSYSPAMCDFLFMVKDKSQFFITGPKVIKALTGEDVTMEELGGSDIHSVHSGQAHFVCENDTECIQKIKLLLDYLLNRQVIFNNQDKIDYRKIGSQIEHIVPEYKKKVYDVKDIIIRIFDKMYFFEILPNFAKNLVIGFARLNGVTVGVVANQPTNKGGALDCDASDKCARFVRTCDCFAIPVIVFEDVPGFYPGSEEEKKGILRHGSKILYAFSEATVPKITVIMRKAYGGAYCAMNSKALGADYVYAWPICEIAVMGAEGAVDVLFHKQISESSDPEKYRKREIEKYETKYLNPYFAASYGMVDDIILPENTREVLDNALCSLMYKLNTDDREKKHGNISL